jgi:TonB-linked SusC/RagA family outer membrane protein
MGNPLAKRFARSMLAGAWLAFGAPVLLAQGGTIVGRVIDSRMNLPVAQAAVEVDGTRLGTTTGADGRFRVANIPAGAHALIARRIGYGSARKPVTIVAGSELTVDFALEPAAVSLDEVVVTGTAGGEQRRSVGNAVSTIDAADVLAKSGAPTLTSLLSARSPGVNVLSTTGRVGAGPSIQIRGRNSLSLGNSPLIYLDGVRVNSASGTGPSALSGRLGGQGASVAGRLNDLNPDDIESIEVISGPAAATIYGTDAASGVIQIITKRGHAAKPQFSMRVEEGSLYFRDASERVQTNYFKDPKSGAIVPWNGIEQQADSGHPLFRTGLVRHYNGSVNGGNDDYRFYVSSGYNNDYGIEPNNTSRMFSVHGNVTTSLGARSDINTSLNFVKKSDHLGADMGASALIGAQYGHGLIYPSGKGFYPNFPPDVPQKLYDNADAVDRFTGSATLNNRLTDWFTQRAVLGIDYTGNDSRSIEHFAPADLAAFLSASQAAGSILQTLRHVSIVTADYGGTAKAALTSNLVASTSVGGQFNNSESNTSQLGGSGFPANGVETVTSLTTPIAATQTQLINTTIGAYAQEQLAWRDRLFVTGALRVDNNSAFGEDFKWVTYPKLSVSWVASDEEFLRGSRVLPTLRLRAAYGENGRSPNAFSALRTFSPVPGAAAVTPGNIGNPLLKPERSRGYEVGFEANFYNRLSLDVTYFSQRTLDAILDQAVAPSSGFSGTRPVNLGRVDNRGIEAQGTLQALTRRNVSWDITGNIGTNRDVVRDLGGLPSLITIAGTANVVDYPIGGIWSKRIVSADRDATTKLATNVLCDGGNGKPAIACAQAPFVFLGTATPKVTGAITNTISIGRRLQFYVLTDFKRGNLLVNNVDLVRCTSLTGAPLCERNYFPEKYDILLLAASTPTARTANALDQYYTDGSFVKLREVSARYTIPEQWLRGVSNASLVLGARELHTWTKYTGLDPEGLFNGNDQAVTPPLTQFLVTLNVRF